MWYLKKIPQILHVYFGGETLPYARYMTIESFRKLNSDWKIKFYYPKFPYKIKSWISFEQKYELEVKDYLPELKKLPNIEFISVDFKKYEISNDISEVYKSDYLRWYLLSSEGGLWSDMDILYFNSMSNISFNKPENSNIDTGICINRIYGHSIGFMLSSANNLYYKYICDRAKQSWNKNNYQSIGSVLSGNLFPNIETIIKIFPTLTPINIPMDVVYAYNSLNVMDIFKSGDMSKFTNNSIGLHWYAGHPLAGDFLRTTNGGVNNLKTCVFGKTLAALISKPLTSYINTLINNKNSTVLDVGCGDKQIIKSLIGLHTTLDIWKKFEPDVIWDLNILPLPFQDNAFEIVLMLDVIEHLNKENGEKLLKEVKRVTKNKIILFTPLWWTENIYYMNDPYSAYFGNEYERHQSLWFKEDFNDGWEEIKELDFLGNYYLGVWNKNE